MAASASSRPAVWPVTPAVMAGRVGRGRSAGSAPCWPLLDWRWWSPAALGPARGSPRNRSWGTASSSRWVSSSLGPAGSARPARGRWSCTRAGAWPCGTPPPPAVGPGWWPSRWAVPCPSGARCTLWPATPTATTGRSWPGMWEPRSGSKAPRWSWARWAAKASSCRRAVEPTALGSCWSSPEGRTARAGNGVVSPRAGVGQPPRACLLMP
ncbi:hypothetical protein ACFFX0_31960 [Citricoccus parietis]|uniref:Secreted protein n=1 Tax=Citricoccus parietis TaxID=592307 RepID=A0ABV5G9H7_9MICC